MDWMDGFYPIVGISDPWIGVKHGGNLGGLIGVNSALHAAPQLDIIIWLVCACLGGIAAILGSLMFLGSLLLWWIPQGSTKSGTSALPAWQGRLKVLAVAGLIAIVGMGVLAIVPYPYLPMH
jgi:hypothetical protein